MKKVEQKLQRKLHLKKFISRAKEQLGLKRVYPSKRYEIYEKASAIAARSGFAPEMVELMEKAETAKANKKSKKKSAYQRAIELERDKQKLSSNALRVRMHRMKKAMKNG